MSSDLEILEERILASVPRGRDGHEEFRLTFTRGRSADGQERAWHSARVFYRKDDGEWRPGKQGVTIRGRELAAVTIALLRALASSIPPELHGAAKQLVAALEKAHPTQPARASTSTSYRRRPPEMRPVPPPTPRADGVDDAEIF